MGSGSKNTGSIRNCDWDDIEALSNGEGPPSGPPSRGSRLSGTPTGTVYGEMPSTHFPNPHHDATLAQYGTYGQLKAHQAPTNYRKVYLIVVAALVVIAAVVGIVITVICLNNTGGGSNNEPIEGNTVTTTPGSTSSTTPGSTSSTSTTPQSQ